MTMFEPRIEAAGARPVALADLFAMPRGDFAPLLPGSLPEPGFQPRLAAARLDDDHGFRADTLAATLGQSPENPPIDLAAAREAELAAARTEAYEAGLEAGRAESVHAVEQIVGECRALIHALDAARTIDKAALGPAMRKAVLDLTSQIVEAHIAVEPAFINNCVARVLATLKEAHEAARLYLHPEDMAVIGADAGEGYANLTILADAEVPRGTVKLEAGGGEVEDGVRPRIARLEKALRAAGLAA